jgi:perosamine synthetase
MWFNSIKLLNKKDNPKKMEEEFWRFDEKELRNVTEFLSKKPSRSLITELETKFAEKFGVKYAIGMNSGTSALDSCIHTIGIEAGDEVIVPPLSFISTAFCVLYSGGTPVFADIDPETFTIDPEDIERKITPKTKAIITVSIYGLSPDMDKIMEIAKKHNLMVIEDNAQCLTGKYKGRSLGTIGDLAIYSFERTKHMTCGDGGMIITNNPDLAKKARKWGKLGYTTISADSTGAKPPAKLMQSPNFERHDEIGVNYRLQEICAAILLAQLEKMDHFVKTRQEIGKVYEEAVKNCEWIKTQRTPEDYEHTYFTAAMVLDTKKVSWQDFKDIYVKMGGNPFYAAWKLSYTEPILKKLGIKGNCPVAENLQPRLMQFKTNFKSKEIAEEQAKILKRTIERIESGIK